MLSKNGLKPAPVTIRAVNKNETPKNAKELKTFLGFTQYLGKLMPDMTTKSAPLREVLQKNVA